ncbi:hypothetical protein [Undibacterium luofuense]|uniref:Uncharacterized protein n=1 Tax=Undibacterium luofuense TaxID=2828733 RepID=A0A941I5L2_9BURK|nr:hypothetical protein [Undibacterium luofuense]MBR7780640.1 hypothetical protein [Undibacterium luofuense]
MGKKFDKAYASLADAYGGIDKFHAEREAMSKEAREVFDQDVLEIGRILRSHLYVEYYIDKYLKEKYCYNRKDLNITFSKKIKIINDKNDELKPFIRSIKRLNLIRNKMAHNLKFRIREEDANFFRNEDLYKNYFFSKIVIDEENKIDVYELYSSLVACRICEILNKKNYLFENVLKAIKDEARDVYFNRA